MNCTITASPVFRLGLTPVELNCLTQCSKLHYDSVCKNAALHGGFLYGWNVAHSFQADETDKAEPFLVQVSATHHQLDICLKILEMPISDHQRVASILRIFLRHCLREARTNIWHLAFNIGSSAETGAQIAQEPGQTGQQGPENR